MNPASRPNLPQLTDTLLTRTAAGLLLLGLAHAVAVADAWLGAGAPGWLRYVSLALSAGIVVLVLPVVVRFVAARRTGACDVSECDGYLSEVFRRACVFAFTTLFILLVALEAVAGHLPGSMGTGVVLNLLLTVTVWVLAGSFFFQSMGEGSAEA